MHQLINIIGKNTNLRMLRLLVLVCSLFMAGFVQATTYYGKNGTTPNTTTNWGTNSGGSGSNPSNYTTAGDVFIIENGTIMTATSVWTIGAAGTTASLLQINNGGTLAMSTYLLTLASCNFSNSGAYSGSGGVTISGSLAANTIGGYTTTGTTTFTKTAGTATITGNVNGAALNINGSGGTLNLGVGLTHTFTGVITLTAGTLNGGSSILNENATSATAFGGTGANFSAGTGTVVLGGAAQTISASSTTTFNNLTLAGSNAKTFSNAVTINGILSMDGTATLTYSTTPTMGASSTLKYNKSASFTTGGEWQSTLAGNLIIANTGTITQSTSSSFVINGNFTVNNGSSINMARPFTVTGTTNISGSLTFSSASVRANTFTGNVTLNSGSSWVASAAAHTYTFAGNFTNNGASTFTASTGVHTFSGPGKTLNGTMSIPSVAITGTITNNGTLTVNAALTGASGTLTNSSTLNLGGTCSIGSTSGGLSNSGTIVVTGSGNITTLVAGFTNTGTINLGGSGAITGITNNAAGIVNLISSGTITSFNNASSTSTLNISASPVPTITTLTATASGNTVDYNSSTGAQSIKGTTYSKLIIDKSGQTGTLGAATTVNGTFTLTNGILTTTSSNKLTITNTATSAITGGSTSSFINGPVVWTLPSNLVSGSTYNFPVGTGTIYLPFALVNPTTGSGSITAQVQSYTTTTGGTYDATLASISSSEYWALTTTGNYTNSSVSLIRQTAITPLDVVAGSTTLSGTYTTLAGTTGVYGVTNSNQIGSNKYFVLGGKKQTISTGTIAGSPFCSGASVSVPYTITGTFVSGNIFTAQLSDASGSFTVPVAIGTLSSTTAGIISGVIPVNTIAGSAYRIRVISSTPSITGSNNGSNLTINSTPTISAYSGSRCGEGIVVISASASAGTINWYPTLSGGTSLGTGTTYTTPSLSSTTTYYADATDGNCISTPRSSAIAAIIAPSSISAGGGGTYCQGSDVHLTSSGTNLINQYWQGPNNFYTLEQNPVLSNVTSAMSGTYTVTGSALSGVNLAINGDFEEGNTGFSSDYLYDNTSLWSEGTYDVVADPHSVHPNFSSCSDHTPSGTLQMVINGATIAGVKVWSQLLNVEPGTDYQFTYFIQSVYPDNPSQLQLYVNGSCVAAEPIFIALSSTCLWSQFTYNWNSGTNTTATLSLINQNIIANGNDFALDDITFQQICSSSTSEYVSIDSTSVGGTASATTSTICAGTNTTITLTGYTGTIQWQSDASGTWANINGETSATYATPNLATTTSFRAIVTSGVCSSQYSTTATVTINSPSSAYLSNGDYEWAGNISNDWFTVSNWLIFNDSIYAMASALPDSSKNVYIRTTSGCASNYAFINGTASCNSLTIESQLTMVNTSVLNVSGNFTNTGTFNAGSGMVNFIGKATPSKGLVTQSIRSGGSTFYGITINNSSGGSAISLTDSLTITHSCIFTNGVVNNYGNTLTFTDSATTNGGTLTSFVNGSVKKTGSDAFKFPVGVVSGINLIWAPIGIEKPSSSSVITAKYNFSASPNNLDSTYMCDLDSLDHTSDIEYWEMTSTNAHPSVTPYWENAVRSGIYVPADIVVAHREDCSGIGKWVSKGGHAVDNLNGTGHITSKMSFGSFSLITLGSRNKSNPLPIGLLSFDASCGINGVDLSWTTATELNNDHFTIQRSTDVLNWQDISTIKGAGNSNEVLKYSATDANSLQGVSYYRLKQTDFDGKSKTFYPVAVSCTADAQALVTYYPNPFTSDLKVEVMNVSSDKGELTIYNLLGNKMVSKKISRTELENQSFTIDLGDLAIGIYTIVFQSDAYVSSAKIVKN